ncbi:MAG: hypothetical protein FWH12_04605 [Treponema sp.]|nr:hypothetical protein [Treponema sp.]
MKGFYGLFGIVLLGFFVSCGANGSPRDKHGQTLDSDFFSSSIQGDLTISAYDSMAYRPLLEEAARLFEALHPQVRVHIDTFSAMPEVRRAEQGNMQVMQVQGQNDPQAREDYLSRVNTSLMGGAGADIYAMDVLPLHNFVGRGVFENLDLYMAQDPAFDRASYRANILDALSFRGGTWFLPLDYSFTYFSYDTTLIGPQEDLLFGPTEAYSTEALLSIGMSIRENDFRIFNAVDHARGGGGMFNLLYNEQIYRFLDLDQRQAHFTDGRFSSLLESVRALGDQGLIPQASGTQAAAGQMMQMEGASNLDRFYFKPQGSVNLLSQFTRGMGPLLAMSTGGSARAIEGDDEIAGIHALADGRVPFTFNQAFGISSQSQNKRAAWEFIKFLLSLDMQLSTNIMNMGLPIHNEARQEKALLDMTTVFSFAQGDLSPLNPQQVEALEAYRRAVEILSDQINTFVIQDSQVNTMVAQEVQQFFGGLRSAEEAARILQNRVGLILSE